MPVCVQLFVWPNFMFPLTGFISNSFVAIVLCARYIWSDFYSDPSEHICHYWVKPSIGQNLCSSVYKCSLRKIWYNFYSDPSEHICARNFIPIVFREREHWWLSLGGLAK